ncbi:hypothetical protein [uncultured Eubacterium sp.]|uniref:hypothetical protein n=1 Tax=uncultured Eubacterium sp. TaxID=165185 RepID=UPI00258A597F|nr:hypothetical protein [uncultured Eubacterium sp.]
MLVRVGRCDSCIVITEIESTSGCMLSTVSVAKDGNIAITYESEVGEITFATYQLSDLLG